MDRDDRDRPHRRRRTTGEDRGWFDDDPRLKGAPRGVSYELAGEYHDFPEFSRSGGSGGAHRGWERHRGGYGSQRGSWTDRGPGERGYSSSGHVELAGGEAFFGDEPGFEGNRGFDPWGYGYGAGGTAGASGDTGWGRDRWEGRDYYTEGGWRTGRFGHDWRTAAGVPYGPDAEGYEDLPEPEDLREQRRTHAGKGPRGYRRSDERIREEVSEVLTRDPDVDASDIEVTVESGEVTLVGTVEDRRQKRIAEVVTERIEGVIDVNNHLRVVGGRERRI